MRKLFLRIMLISVMIAFAMLAIACDGCGGKEGSVTLSKTSLNLEVGATATLTATADNGEDVVFTSGNENVVTVNQQGVVTAISAGTAEVSATAGKASATCVVTVVNPEPKEGLMIKLDKTELSLNVGTNATANLKTAVTKAEEALTDIIVTWKSTNPAVATVENGTVTAVSIGKTDIIARVEKDGEWAEAKCSVNVGGEVVFDFNVDGKDYFVGVEFSITPSVAIGGEPTAEPVTYSVSDKNVLVVKENGKFKPVASGYVTVYASVAGETFERELKIYQKKIEINTEQDFYKLNDADEFDYFELKKDLYFNDINTVWTKENKSMIETFGGIFNGNGYKVTVQKYVSPDDSTTGVNNGYSVLFRDVTETATIKNTRFYITYKAMVTNLNGINQSRTAGFAKTFNGALENCYVYNYADGTTGESSVIYNFGGTIEKTVFNTNSKHVVAWTVAESKNSMTNVMIICGGNFSRIGNISGNYYNVNSVSKYTSIENALLGTGHTITSDGTTVTNTAISATPQYATFANEWTFDTEDGVIALLGKDINDALNVTYASGIISWADLDATSTEIYIDGVKKTVALSGQSFAVVDYLVANAYDVSVPHTVEIKVSNGKYVYSDLVGVKIATVSNESEFRAIDGASVSGYYLLTANITINDTATDKPIIENFGGSLNGNGYKVTITRNVAPADSSDNSKNGYAVLFGTVSGTANIKNTQFDITYKAMQTRVDGGACSRTAGFANTFNGVLQDCYVKNTISGVYENTSVIYNFGGKIIDTIFNVNCKHIVGWEVTNSNNDMDGVMIVYSQFGRIGKISGTYTKFANASKYTSMANLIAGTGSQISIGGTSEAYTAITATPQYMGVFGNAWTFSGSTVTLCGKTVG